MGDETSNRGSGEAPPQARNGREFRRELVGENKRVVEETSLALTAG